MPEPVAQTDELTKVFRDFWMRPRVKAVDAVSLSVQAGEVFGLLGPNGSGKSTTIKLLLGLLFPSKGRVAIFGKPPTDVAVRRRVGFLPEESHLYPYLTAEEALDFYGRLFGLDADERKRRTEALLRLTGLVGARDRLIGEFSKGMSRRVGIAQALINDPDFVILDEPTSGLDPLGAREIKDLILQLRGRGKTVFLSSHLLADVEDVCDRVAILYGGRVQAEGATGDLLREEALTQITTALDAETLQQVTELIRKRSGPDATLTVEPPRKRLESYFLRVVEEARSAAQPTSGVEGAEGDLSFLGGAGAAEEAAGGEALLERLTAPAGPVPVAAEDAASAREPSEGRARETGDAAVLDRLAQPTEGAGSAAPSETETGPTASPGLAERGRDESEGTDAGVLDRLTRPRREGDDGADGPPPTDGGA